MIAPVGFPEKERCGCAFYRHIAVFVTGHKYNSMGIWRISPRLNRILEKIASVLWKYAVKSGADKPNPG